MSDLFFSHRLIFDLFYYDYSKILEGVVFASEVLIYLDGVLFFRVIPMLVDSPVGLLGLQLANILLPILASIAPGEVYCVPGAAVGFLADLEPFIPCSVCEECRIHHMSAA